MEEAYLVIETTYVTFFLTLKVTALALSPKLEFTFPDMNHRDLGQGLA